MIRSEDFECPHCEKKGGMIFRVKHIEGFTFTLHEQKPRCRLGQSVDYETDVDGEFYCSFCKTDVMFWSDDYPGG